MDGVRKISHNAGRKVCGVGYVVLSRAQDRDTYIGSCFRNNMITIVTEENEIIPKCIVGKNAWQYLDFPLTIKQRGSAVVWINVPFQNKVIILDVLHKRDELNPIQSTGQYKLERKIGENIVTIQGDGTTGTINIIAQGISQKEGEIYIKALSQSELGIFDLYVQGIINLNSESDLNLKVGGKLNILIRDDDNPQNQASLIYTLGTGLTYTDEFDNNITTKNNGIFQEVNPQNKVYARGNGASSEPGLLGNKTYTLLNEIKNLLQDMVITLQAASLPGPAVAAAPITAKVANWTLAITKMQQEILLIKSKNFELS